MNSEPVKPPHVSHDAPHPQVPVLDFTCDEDIAELILLMNVCGIETLLSCQDNNDLRGTARRVWVQLLADDLPHFLELVDRPAEATADTESLSGRIASEYQPDDWEDFREDRAWHYRAYVGRSGGELLLPEIGVRFPYTDLAEVTSRLRDAAGASDPDRWASITEGERS